MKIKYAALLLLLSTFLELHAQKTITDTEQVWVGYFNQTRLSNRWGFWFDGQLRTKEHFVKNLSQLLIRPGITYYVNDATKLTVGYTYVNFYPADSHQYISQPEHRLWQQIQWHTKYRKIKTMQWLRLEERYRHKIKNNYELSDGYSFNWRLRYNFLFQAPLSKKGFVPKTMSFIFNDEIHLNAGRNITYNTFDQNRLFLGFSYQTTQSNNLQFGYMNIYQELPAGNQYRSIHTARIFYFHNLDLRKKK